MKKMILFHSILVLGGMVSGVIAFFCLPEEQVLALQQYLLVQMQELTGTATLAEAAGRILRANGMDLIRLYLSGACLAGLPLLLLMMFLKGFSFGFTACFLLGHSILLLFTRLLYFPLLIGAAALGCRFNLLMLQNRLSSPLRQLLQYTIAFGGLLLLALLCSYIDGLSCCHYLQQLQ